MQCEFVFLEEPDAYREEDSRIRYVASLLSGKPLAWFLAAWEVGAPCMQNYNSFCSEFRSIFDHPTRALHAAGRLHHIRQGTRSVSEYAIDFRILAADSGFNDLALQVAFREGLSEGLKDELAVRDPPSSLDQLVRLTINIDHRLSERRRSHRQEASGRTSHPARTPAVQEPYLPPHLRWSPPTPTERPSTNIDVEEPMQVNRTRLSLEERRRRRNQGLCVYCAREGHQIDACPLRPKDGTHRQGEPW